MQIHFPITVIRPALTSFFALLLCFCISSNPSFAQNSKPKSDSLTKARIHQQDSMRKVMEQNRAFQKAKIDSTRAAQKVLLDNLRATRMRSLDSLKASRKIVTDSLGAIRKYRESKRYKDSVTRSRANKIAIIRAAQKAKTDALRTIRQRSTDSMIAIRKHFTDSLKTIQKKRSDSLSKIRTYRESKHFKDSVTVIRRAKMEALAAARKAYNDSLFTVRKASIDSARTSRKHIIDSTTAVRTKSLDSLKAVRKVRTDSLAKAKEARDKTQKVKDKQKESSANLKFELKLKQKRSVYSNNKMLKKKWGIPRQLVQNTFTHYNYYFNADRKMDEAKLNMQRLAKDDFNKQIELFSFDPNRDSTVLAADMDSIIQKTSLGIQIHDPRTKWAGDLYLLLGQAFFYKGDYNNAEASFRYIVAMRAKERAAKAKKDAEKRGYTRGKKEQPSVVEEDKKSLLDFLKHESVNNEALLWVARTYTQAGKFEQSASVLDLLTSDSKFPEDLKGKLALELAFLNLKEGNNREAATQLAIVSEDRQQDFFIRRRASYLGGQLYEQSKDYTAAAKLFEKVSDLLPKIDMDFYARRNRAYSLMLAGGAQDEAIASLKSMLRDGKYAAYNEQIYFVLGRLSQNAENTKDAETYLRKSVTATKTTKKQKASSFAALGNLYYKTGNWEAAKSSYDSASRLASYAPDDTSVLVGVRRGKVLDKVAGPARTISTQDSLLALGALTEKEQHSVARKYIRSIEQRRADSVLRAENAANAPGQQPTEAEGGQANMTWYFSNPTLTQQGFTEFKRKWGNRPLADNWRRGAASGMPGSNTNNANSAPTFTGGDGSGKNSLPGIDESGLPTEEALLAGIPTSASGRAEAVRQIQRAYIDLGTAYVADLEDYNRAITAFDQLDKRYATHPYSAEELYQRYLTALRQNNLPQAKIYSDQLLQQYGSSKWADNVRPTGNTGAESTLGAGNILSVADYYDETYSLLMQRQYGDVLNRSRTGKQRYKDETYRNRFRIMEAIAVAGSGNYRQADTLLADFIRTHPTDSLRSWADNVMRYVQEQIKLDTVKPVVITPIVAPNAGLVNAKGVDSTAALSKLKPGAPNSGTIATPLAGNTIIPKQVSNLAYSYNPAEEHYFIFYVKNSDSRSMGVKAGVKDFNTMKYGSNGLLVEVDPLVGNEVIIVVKKFSNAGKAKVYLADFKKTPQLLREYATGQYQLMVISAGNFMKLAADKEMDAYLKFYRGKY